MTTEITPVTGMAELCPHPTITDTNAEASDLFERLRNRKNPYLTPAASAARDDLRNRLPIEYAYKAHAAIEAAATDGKYENHNVLTCAAALAYADKGLHVVDAHALDCKGKGTGPGGLSKVPRAAKWQERASSDQSEVLDFWTGNGEYPADKKGKIYQYAPVSAPRNVSIAFPDGCGLFVLDIDGEAGLKALAELEEKHGTLPFTWESQTGSGGLHLIFRAEGLDIRNTASSIAPGVDVRGKNGQIVAPPSIHPSGNFYRWQDGCAPWEIEVAEAPEWLKTEVYEATKGRGAEPTKTTKKSDKKRNSVSTNGTPQSSNARGFEAHLEEIGDGDDLRGFDGPIYVAACAYFARHGTEADEFELMEELREAVLAAPCKDDRAESRYATDDYLETRIEQARGYIAENSDDESAEFEDPKDYLPEPYIRGDDMIFYQSTNDDGDTVNIPVCGVFELHGRTMNEAGDSEAGRVISFKSESGKNVTLTISRAELYAHPKNVWEQLADAGLPLAGRDKKAEDRMLNLLAEMTPQCQITTLHTPGLIRDDQHQVLGFMLPTGQSVMQEEQGYRLHEDSTVPDTRPAGLPEGWTDAADAALSHVKGNPYWTLAVCSAFAGPLLEILSWNPLGFNFSGPTSKGKSLGEMLCTAAWGNPADGKSTFWGANSTPNAMEDLAVYGSGTCLCVDELGAMQDKRVLAPLMFALHSGRGKARKRGNGAGLTKTAEFRPFVLFSSESSIKAEVEAAGVPYRGGMAVRFPDVDVSDGKSRTHDEIAEIEKCKRNYGHAGPEFIEHLLSADVVDDPDGLEKEVNEIVATLAAGKASGLKRAARPFALAQRAGELACDAKILKNVDAVREGVKRCWEIFLKSEEAATANGNESLMDGFVSWVHSQMDITIIPAKGDVGTAPSNSEGRGRVIGWYSDDQIIFDWKALEAMDIPNTYGKRQSLVAALAGLDALDRSSSSNVPYSSLPPEVGELPDGGSKRVKNMRVWRNKLGI